MCAPSCLEFVSKRLRRDEVRGKTVLEVGSRDINGSVRSLIERHAPLRYLGVDLFPGPGVDQTCCAEDLIETVGVDAFDVVVSTELLEHVRDWRKVIHNFKTVVKPGGLLVLTTRSRGTQFHGYPHDYWRFETTDFQALFSDFRVECIEKDTSPPGVFIKAWKPVPFTEKDLAGYPLYSIVKNRPVADFGTMDYAVFRVRLAVRELLSRAPLSPVKALLKTFYSPRTYP